MGLDMYLYRKFYVKNWNHTKPEEQHQITVLKGGKPTNIKPDRISYVVEEVAYWRKANQIHKWFVDNCQDGIDDCRDAYVERGQLEQLCDLCRQVLDTAKTKNGKIQNGSQSVAGGGWEPIMEDGAVITNAAIVAKLLPAGGGFFFGSTDYDNYYLDDVKFTLETLDALLKEDSDGDYYYHSSW